MDEKESSEIRRSRPAVPLVAISVLYFLASGITVAIGVLSFTNYGLFKDIPGFNKPSLYFPQVFGLFGAFMIVLAVLFLVSAIGLLKRKNWARIIIVIIAIMNILGGSVSLISGNYISLLNIALNITIGSYLILSKKNSFPRIRLFGVRSNRLAVNS